MWKGKKRHALIAVLVAVVLVGSLGGVAYAQTGSTSDGSGKTLLARVAAILGIEPQKVEDAFAQAQKEMQEEALDSYLKQQVEQGKMTQEQANQYKQWWQSRPDTTQLQKQLREWQQARPDIRVPGGFGDKGFRGGMGRGFGCW